MFRETLSQKQRKPCGGFGLAAQFPTLLTQSCLREIKRTLSELVWNRGKI